MTPTKGTILVVDDRPASRYPVVHALKRAGFEVIEASTGKEALELSTGMPDVIVLDVKLPDILGYEVCRRIKANANTNHILVLQLSAAFLSNESKVHALESGADAFLTPPVEPNVLVATVRSLVRLHDAELRNRRLGEQWQTTFDALSEGVALADAAGIVQRTNHAMTVMLGQSYSEIEDRPLADLVRQSFGLELGTTGLPSMQETQVGTRYFRFNVTPVIRNEVEAGSVFIVSEITEQKRAQAAFVINERLAATGRMANTIAHEINNPLEAITNLLYLMKDALHSPEAAAELLESAQEQVSRVSRIARQILAFNRESKETTPVRLFELLEDVLALNNRALLANNLQIEKDWDESIVIHGFPAQLRQVFSNLLRNAIEASPSGGTIRVKISGCHSRPKAPGQTARVTFADRGVGIARENLKRVFEAFFTTKELKGSGIGLWLSNTIVQEHRGRIQVRSSIRPPVTGTCVSVLLPCQDAMLDQS
jgi:two-component system, NtrC family, sensor kinase